MALIEVSFYSAALGMNCQANVILPQDCSAIGSRARNVDGKYPVLYLLHPAGGNHSIWCRKTRIEQYAERFGVAVVMPEVHLSMYANMAYGGRYFDYIAEELPGIMQGMFPVSGLREASYIAGASMGGYGAMKTGLLKAAQFCAVGCFSSGNLWKRSIFDNNSTKVGRDDRQRNMAVFGTDDVKKLEGSVHDLKKLAGDCAENEKILPEIYLECGTEDFLLELSREMKEWFQKDGRFVCHYQERPGGHTWEFFDACVLRFLKWIFPVVLKTEGRQRRV